MANAYLCYEARKPALALAEMRGLPAAVNRFDFFFQVDIDFRLMLNCGFNRSF